MTLVVVGQGYVGLPARHAGRRGRATTSSASTSTRAGSSACAAGDSLRRGRQRRAARARRSTPGATGRPSDPAELAGFDVAVISVPTPLRDGNPDLSYIEAPAAALARHLRPGATVVLESTTYPGTTEELVAPDPRGRLRPHRRRRLPPRLQPRAHRPRQPDVDASRTPRRSCRASTPRRSARCRRSTTSSSSATVAGRRRRGGRADQAAREHLPPRQHRAGQRAGDVRPRPRHRRVGGDRRRVDQAVRLHALHARARASAATACRSTRPTCRGGCGERSAQPFRFVELANDVNDHMPDYVVRRLDRTR